MNTKLFPILDLPSEFIAKEDVTGDTLRAYGGFPCRIRAALFIYCIEGLVSVRINLQDHTLSQGDFCLLLPNSFIQILDIRESTRVRLVGLSASFIESYNMLQPISSSVDVIAREPIVPLNTEQAEVFASAISMLRQSDLLKPEEIRNQLICNTIESIAMMIVPLFSQPSFRHRTRISRSEDIVQQFYALVMKHYSTEHKVSYYARQLNISSPYLCAIISKQTGVTALQIINRSIITDAKSQLRTGNQPVKSIALSLGFDNTAFFSKFFRSQTGQTPLEYRKTSGN